MDGKIESAAMALAIAWPRASSGLRRPPEHLSGGLARWLLDALAVVQQRLGIDVCGGEDSLGRILSGPGDIVVIGQYAYLGGSGRDVGRQHPAEDPDSSVMQAAPQDVYFTLQP
jgi:hypothetical protein